MIKEYLVDANTVFHCKTQEEALFVLGLAKQHGLSIGYGEINLGNTYWREHGENTCYSFSGESFWGSYSSLDKYKDLIGNKLRVVTFDDVFFDIRLISEMIYITGLERIKQLNGNENN